MSRNYQWFIGGSILLAIVLFGSYFAIKKSAPPTVAVNSYTAGDKEKPKVEIGETSFDLGEMKVSEEKSAEFTFKNVGAKPLQLYDISSSCGCTVGQIVYRGKTSKEFGMHAVGSFDQVIAPGATAVVKVIYRPYVMPVYGAVDREVYLSTNDPAQPKLVFKVKAFVK